MELGESLGAARRAAGRTQEETAEVLGVSRQTISKWEMGETLPDIVQCQKLAALYGTDLNRLVAFDPEIQRVHDAIAHTAENLVDRIDWTRAWAGKYPILASYPDQMESVDISRYAGELASLMQELEEAYGWSRQDAMLVLKDILYRVWKAMR